MRPASLFPVMFVLAMASSAIAAEPPAAAGPESGALVVLDDTTLWRHFHVSGASHIRAADGELSKAYIDWGAKMREAAHNEFLRLPRDEGGRKPPDLESPLPPADWASPAFDDSAWPRLWWPQPELPWKWYCNCTDTRARYPYHTVVVLARGKFEIKDPAQVRACTLSLDYWGGVVVYVNGKEAARGHMTGDSANLATPAEDYPVDAFTTPDGKPLRLVEVDVLRGADLGDAAARLALRDRKLRDVKIPAALLRQGVMVPGAVAPLWFTVRVPRDAKPGVYEGKVSVAAEGLASTTVPLRLHVCDWVMPDPRDFRIQNFLYHAEEVEARHYEVPNYSDKHLDLVGRSLTLLAEVNSRQIQANLATEFFGRGANPESLVRWIKQPDGSFKHDFTNFDRYLDMVAKYLGKPRTLRLNCWGCRDSPGHENCGTTVSVLDPATGKIGSMRQPELGTEESLAFWRPVFDEILKKLNARGWLDDTTLGYNAHARLPLPAMTDVASKLWPEGEWSWTSHSAREGWKFEGTDKSVAMTVRHADGVWGHVPSGKFPPLYTLAQPRRTTYCTTCRNVLNDNSPPREMRRLVELYAMNRGYDGVSEFGADLFPQKRPLGGYCIPPAGRGTGWTGQWTTLSLLYPGPDGPVATERFEMFREGVELCEAILFVRHALEKKQLSGGLLQRADRYLHLRDRRGECERDVAFGQGWFGARYMQAEEDAKLLDLTGEVAQELQRNARKEN